MLTSHAIDTVVRAALDEDAPWGDLTSEVLIPADALATAQLVAREPGVFSGEAVFEAAFRLTDPRILVHRLTADGAAFAAGDVLAEASGPARGILQAERIGLNFVQRMSGIATLTSAHVFAVKDTRARITDTRKTTPGLRALEKYAVRCGGGFNHRFGLDDAILIKDNHIAVAGGIRAVLERAKAAAGHLVKIEIEVDSLEQLQEVLDCGLADVVLIDNFDVASMRKAVEQVAGRLVIEASGGITLDTIGEIATTGVDYASSGALTHSAPALDVGLDIEI